MLKIFGLTASGRSPLTAMAGALTLGALTLSGAASAQQQRDPAYAAARSAGQVGEKVDGYLGYPSTPSPEVRRLADDINIKRRAIYAEKAAEQHATVEQYAFTTGCLLISKTAVGEKYQAPDGSWQTRTAAPPLRDSRCP
ncbi:MULTISPECIES: YdbL family protein [unclassified Novosphingobium]|uniref:YdbL family protein n=1 Tax=unclassified Novosphingobium TaxID=2644732 RepID=UPI0025CF817A|nr:MULTISPECIES: YdbL family protein [unclassified Novosphingobium]HQV03719.1 YdbL family protein [Novosphingobium sp.]